MRKKTGRPGNVRSASGESGLTDARYEYDAFGTPYLGDLSGGMNLGYTGKPYDPATGLYNYGYRDYRPAAARFTTPDPIRDGSNWFVYVNNDPVNFLDEDGLLPQAVIGGIIGFVVSSAIEVGSRRASGQSFTAAVRDIVQSPEALANIATSTVLGALTAGVSAAATTATTSAIRNAAVIGANTAGKEATATVIINTVGGGLGAAMNDVVTKAVTGTPQDPIQTLEVAAIGAAISFTASAATQRTIALGTNADTYIYNDISRTTPHAPQWTGIASTAGETLAPAAFEVIIGILSSTNQGGRCAN